MTLEEKKQAVIEEFSMYDEWLDKYEYLIELGKALEPYPEEEKTEDRLIKGCQSRVWLDYELKDGKLYYYDQPTPFAANGVGFAGYAPMPSFSVEPGFFGSAQNLRINAAEGMQVFYTTDGTEPQVGQARFYIRKIFG